MYGQHMTLSRFCKQMLSVRINFPFIYCFMPSKNGAGVLRDQQFSPVCVFGPALPSNCFFVFGGGRQLCGNPFRLMLDSFQPIAGIPKCAPPSKEKRSRSVPVQQRMSKQSVGHFEQLE